MQQISRLRFAPLEMTRYAAPLGMTVQLKVENGYRRKKIKKK
jgi:hypothetical protein